jgi:hypothetical protein
LKSRDFGTRFAASVVPTVTHVFEERTRENPPEGLETPGLVELCDHDQTFGSSPCLPLLPFLLWDRLSRERSAAAMVHLCRCLTCSCA